MPELQKKVTATSSLQARAIFFQIASYLPTKLSQEVSSKRREMFCKCLRSGLAGFCLPAASPALWYPALPLPWEHDSQVQLDELQNPLWFLKQISFTRAPQGVPAAEGRWARGAAAKGHVQPSLGLVPGEILGRKPVSGPGLSSRCRRLPGRGHRDAVCLQAEPVLSPRRQ